MGFVDSFVDNAREQDVGMRGIRRSDSGLLMRNENGNGNIVIKTYFRFRSNAVRAQLNSHIGGADIDWQMVQEKIPPPEMVITVSRLQL